MDPNDLSTMSLDELQEFENKLNQMEIQTQYSAEAGYPQQSLTAPPEHSLGRKILEAGIGFIPGVGTLHRLATQEKEGYQFEDTPDGGYKVVPGYTGKQKQERIGGVLTEAGTLAGLGMLGLLQKAKILREVFPAFKNISRESPSIRQSDKLASMLQQTFAKTAVRGKGGYVKRGVETPSMRRRGLELPAALERKLLPEMELPGPEPPFRPQIAAESGWTDILGPGWTDIPGGLPQVKGLLPPASPTRIPSTVEQLRRGAGFRENLNLVEQLLSMGEGI